ncbi:MAG: S9 family peptidase [Acidobacteriota bacterium]
MKKFINLLFALILIFPLFSDKKPMEIEDVLKIKSVSNPRISREGKFIVFEVREVLMDKNEYNSDLYLINLENIQIIRLTYDLKNDFYPRFSPDLKYLAFLSDREEKNQIFLFSLKGGEPFKLTDSKTGITSFAWTTDGNYIIYRAPDPPTEEEEKRKKEKDDAIIVDKDLKNNHLWKINIESKETKKITDGNFNVNSFEISPDDSKIAFTASPTPKVADTLETEIYIIPIDGEKPEKITDNKTSEFNLVWDDNNQYLYFLANSNEFLKYPGQGKIFSLELSTRLPKCLTKNFSGDILSFILNKNKGNIIFVAHEGVNQNLYSFSLTGNTITEFSKGNHVISSINYVNGEVLTFILQDPENPGEVFISNVEHFNPKKLTDLNASIKDFNLGIYKTVKWKSKDKKEIEGLLVLPHDYEEGKKYPLIVQLHGGPASAYLNSFSSSWSTYVNVLTGKGFTIFQPNYRGSTGYGDDFMREIEGKYFDKSIDDIITGIDHLISKGIADEAKIGVMGWSAGGHMTNWLITHFPYKFKAASSGAGVANWVSLYSQTDIQYTREQYLLDKPWNNLDHYIKYSPLTYIKNVKTPTLILFGEKDERIPTPQGQELYMGLLKNGVPVEFVIFPREPRGLREPKHQIFKMKKELEWFEKWILKK